MRYYVNYSGTRFLSTEKWKFLLHFLMDSVFKSPFFTLYSSDTSLDSKCQSLLPKKDLYKKPGSKLITI